MTTILRVRVVSCDAKIIGSLVGGCRITVRDVATKALLAEGIQVGESGDTKAIMQTPHKRGSIVYDTPGAACFEVALELEQPTLVKISAEGPLAFPHALQSATKTTWMIPGEDVVGEGFVLELNGFIVDILQPHAVDVLHSNEKVYLEAGVRLL